MRPYYLTSVLQLVGVRRVYVEKAAWIYHFWPTSTGLWQIPAGKAIWCSALGEGGWRELYSATVSPSEVNQSPPEAPNREKGLVKVPHTHIICDMSPFSPLEEVYTLQNVFSMLSFLSFTSLFPLFYETAPYGRDWVQFSPGNCVESFYRKRSAKIIPDRKWSFLRRYT